MVSRSYNIPRAFTLVPAAVSEVTHIALTAVRRTPRGHSSQLLVRSYDPCRTAMFYGAHTNRRAEFDTRLPHSSLRRSGRPQSSCTTIASHGEVTGARINLSRGERHCGMAESRRVCPVPSTEKTRPAPSPIMPPLLILAFAADQPLRRRRWRRQSQSSQPSASL